VDQGFLRRLLIRASCRGDTLCLFGKARFTKSQCLSFTGMDDKVEFLDGMSACKKFRLSVSERDLSLLSRF
jgi:hypothetical protein